MPLPDPQLDDRRFQDLVNEAKGLIPRYCPEWTDHNLSDPGVTLIELFAWMTDLLLYRLNRVPAKNYLRFLDLLGIRLKDAVPGRAPVTFALSAPQPGPVTIPRGTEVATVRTGDRPAISFATETDLVIWPPTLRQCLASSDDTAFADLTDRLNDETVYFDAFQPQPLPGDALYFGFPENISAHTLSLVFDCMVEGIGVDPRDPPLSWEAWCGGARGWEKCDVERDETGGLNQKGTVVLYLPEEMEARLLLRQPLYWVRLRLIQPRPRQPAYSASPRINTVGVTAIGATSWASHSMLIQGQVLGRATGTPGESFELENTPVLPRHDDEHLEVQGESGEWIPWREVQSFQDSGPGDRHYMLDGVTGTVTFGPTIRQQDGTERPFGAVPEKGSYIRVARYRVGGGIGGNVGANTLTVLKSSIPYVARVTNRLAAVGGLDPETVDAAKLRAPAALRSQERAVTAGDYEFLALQASRRIARAKCIQARSEARGSATPPGTVEVLIVPLLPADHPRTLQALQPPPEMLEEVRSFLDERRLLGTQLVVDGPGYLGVIVEANIVVERQGNADQVRERVLRRITEHLDPLNGGPDGGGWPFGRDLYLSEMQSVVQSVPGVEYAQDVTIYQVDIQTGQSRAAGQKITLAEDILLLSYDHIVTVAPRER